MSKRPRIPGDGLLHPLPIVSMGVLALNDHVLKAAYGTWWTGKLSDVAGLAFFPLVLQGLWEVGRQLVGRPSRPSRRVLVGAALASAAVFALANLWEPGAQAYRHGLGGLQWPVRAVLAVIRGHALPQLGAVDFTRDPTDLLALPAVLLAVGAGWRRCDSPPA
jgi:hypothetical protein